MSPELYLVRHTEVELRPDVPAFEWRPTPGGLAAAARLGIAPAWRSLALVATSTEPKARATAEPIAAAAGLKLRAEPDLREVDRPGVRIMDRADWVELVCRYLSGEDLPGWEAASEARGRFETCLERLLGDAAGPLAVVSHGTVMSLYLGLASSEWDAIPLPGIAVADPATRRLVRPFVDVEAFLAQSSS